VLAVLDFCQTSSQVLLPSETHGSSWPAFASASPLTTSSPPAGYHGKPFFVQNPNDDSIAVMEVRERSVGSERFAFVATEP